MRQAAAFLRNGKVFLHPYSGTTAGFWIFSMPVLVLNEGDENTGAQILLALSNSRENIPHPPTWTGLVDPLLNTAGVKSFNSFMKGAKCVDVSHDQKGVTFTPTTNGGPRKGFVALTGKGIKAGTSEEELTRGLRAAFDACE